jgi:Calcineurin-like phosphoesterase
VFAVLATSLICTLAAAGAGVSAPHRPTAAPLRQATVWAVGDGADGTGTASALARRMASGRIDRFLYLGDVYPNGTADDFAQHYTPVYGFLAKKTSPTPGNHEWPTRASGYEPYWRAARRTAIPDYYAFSIAGWQIISLNSEAAHDAASPQLRWLRARLRSRGTCRLAFWHRPRYSAGSVHGDQPDVQPFWDALAGHAAIVVNGHEHDMQQLKPVRGITELVSGAGGSRLYSVNLADRRLAFANGTQNGALRLVLTRGLARFAFVLTDGTTVDSGRIHCRPLRPRSSP